MLQRVCRSSCPRAFFGVRRFIPNAASRGQLQRIEREGTASDRKSIVIAKSDKLRSLVRRLRVKVARLVRSLLYVCASSSSQRSARNIVPNKGCSRTFHPLKRGVLERCGILCRAMVIRPRCGSPIRHRRCGDPRSCNTCPKARILHARKLGKCMQKRSACRRMTTGCRSFVPKKGTEKRPKRTLHGLDRTAASIRSPSIPAAKQLSNDGMAAKASNIASSRGKPAGNRVRVRHGASSLPIYLQAAYIRKPA